MLFSVNSCFVWLFGSSLLLEEAIPPFLSNEIENDVVFLRQKNVVPRRGGKYSELKWNNIAMLRPIYLFAVGFQSVFSIFSRIAQDVFTLDAVLN